MDGECREGPAQVRDGSSVIEGYLPVGVGESERELGAASGPWAGPEHFLEVEKTEGGPSASLAS